MDCGPPIVSLNTNKLLLIIIPVWYRVPRLRVLFQVLSLSHTPTPVVHTIRKYFSSHTLHIQDIRAPKGRPCMNKKQRPCSTYYKAVRVWGGGNNGGHVLGETTSRGLCGLVCPSRTSERGGEGYCVKEGGEEGERERERARKM
jgi:hypothetical protein